MVTEIRSIAMSRVPAGSSKGIQSVVFGAMVAMALAIAPMRSAQADPIRVDVNGSPVDFGYSTQPVEENGSVLVPLRGVFQAMGANVDYDSGARTIYVDKGDTHVVLPLGATIATVNGQSESLSEPARVHQGSTLVPLRFVAESLGAYVQWRSADSTVAIRTNSNVAEVPVGSFPHRASGELHGTVTDIDSHNITVRTHDGDLVTAGIDASTSVMRSQSGRTDWTVPLSAIHVGDRVSVQQDEDGVATNITGRFSEVHGTVQSIDRMADGRRSVTLNNGDVVAVRSGTSVWMNGSRVTLGDVAPGDHVEIRTDPDDNIGYSVIVTPHNGAPWRAHRGY